MHLHDLLAALKEMAPEESALPNDPVGLLISPQVTEIDTVAVCLDAYSPVVSRVISGGFQLIVCHHPLIFTPLHRLDGDGVSPIVMHIVRAGIGLYAMHTNWDRAENGINETLAALLGLSHVKVLGSVGPAAIARIGVLPEPHSHDELAVRIAKALDCSGTSALRSVRSKTGRAIRAVAVCGGAGGSLAIDAAAAGADALITADVRHHEYLTAYGLDLALFDAGHAATEEPGMKALAEQLHKRLPDVAVEFFGI